MSEKQTWCGMCGVEGVALVLWERPKGNTYLCSKCEEKRQQGVQLAQQILDGTAPPTTPDFGFHCDEAVRLACAMFPATFKLRGHDGTFRVSERASYVSRGRVLVYTQRLRTYPLASDPLDPTTCQAEWVDFAKGTIAELKAQIVGGVR